MNLEQINDAKGVKELEVEAEIKEYVQVPLSEYNKLITLLKQSVKRERIMHFMLSVALPWAIVATILLIQR